MLKLRSRRNPYGSREYHKKMAEFLREQTDESLIGLRNSSTSDARRRACENEMRRRGMIEK